LEARKKSLQNLSYWLVLLLFGLACRSPQVVQRPIVFDEQRKDLTLDYLARRYEIMQEEPTIVPRMVVVHWTAIPTLEKSFAAFEQPTLPNWRPEIAGASGLNVSSQYLVDRDGTIYQLLPDTVMARHVIGLNHCAIGIENVGGGKELPLTKAQFRANLKLIRELSEKHPIEYVIGHHEYQRFIGHPLWKETDPNYLTQKSDPGDVFMAELRQRLRKLGLQGPPED
jgi:N-acetyl-anhydromuramyl-L-alanine amidase AmpD